MNINTIVLGGNLTSDPKVVTPRPDLMIAEFSIAVNMGHGENKRAAFIRCKAFNKTAELISQNFNKGKAIIVEGCLYQDVWNDKETGKEVRKTGVLVNKFHFVGKREESPSQQAFQQSQQAPQQAPAGYVAPDQAFPQTYGQQNNTY